MFGNLARIPLVFNKVKIQEQMGGHVFSNCKEDEFEGISVTNFRFTKESLDVSWTHCVTLFMLKKYENTVYNIVHAKLKI